MRSRPAHATGFAAAAAVLALPVVAVAAEPPAAAGGPVRALILFVPGARLTDLAALHVASRPDFALGLMSPALGRRIAAQTYLDIGQGTRADTDLYPPLPPAAARVRGDRVLANAALQRRARSVPARIRPGLLAESLRAAGVRTAYVSGAGGDQPAALTAMDRRGSVARLAVAGARSGPYATRRLAHAVAGRIELAWRANPFVVAVWPRGVLAELRTFTAHLSSRVLVVLVGAPPAGDHMLPVALRGPAAGGGQLKSAATRLPGLVLTTDIAPTVLDHFGAPIPAGLGKPGIEVAGSADPGALRRLDDRLAVIAKRRLAALAVLGAAVAMLLVLCAAFAGRRGLRAGVRVAGLAPLWLPGVLLLGAALRPSPAAEYAILTIGCLGLGALTQSLLKGLRAPVFAVVASAAVVTVDLALGSPLTRLSLLGPNPAYGARFFGLGNELEGLLVVALIIALGAVLDLAGARHKLRGFLAGGVALTVLFGWGRLGADAGGALMIGAGIGVALYSSGAAPAGRRRWYAAIGAALAGAACGLVLVAAVNAVLGGGAHVSAATGGGAGGLRDVLERRLELSLNQLEQPGTAVLAGLAALLMILGWTRRRTLLKPLEAWPAARAGALGAGAAILVGFLANDSGGVILIGGVVVLAFYLAYVRASQADLGRPRRSGQANEPVPAVY